MDGGAAPHCGPPVTMAAPHSTDHPGLDPIADIGRDVTPDDLASWPFVDRRRRSEPPPRFRGERRAIARLRSSGATAPIAAIRWGALAVGLALASPAIAGGDRGITAWALALVAHAAWCTLRPPQPASERTVIVRVVAEVAVAVAAVLGTGAWSSPYVFSLVTAVMVAGFGRGFAMAIRVSVVAALCVALAGVLRGGPADAVIRESAQWTAVLVLVALMAGHARRISLESATQHSLALDRLGRLAEANALLFSLHRLAQSLPASLDLQEVLASTMGRLRDLLAFDAATVLLLDETDHRWRPARQVGHRGPDSYTTAGLPVPLRRAMMGERIVAEPDLARSGATGLAPDTASGLYAPLRARGALIGLVAVESTQPRAFGERDVELLEGLVAPLALAIDNARWFARLRTIGAEEERTRIARDLHDRIGQSLTFLAFELDRAVKTAGDDVTPVLERLRSDLRDVIREVRDTLYDLRTDVSEERTVAQTLEPYLERVRDRSGLVIELRHHEDRRLPLPQERELWRIATEAITNVERHAKARHLWVEWRCDRAGAALIVRDDGVGFHGATPSRPDSYGVLGMRERAASIGASLTIDSSPGTGTTVRVTLPPPKTPEVNP